MRTPIPGTQHLAILLMLVAAAAGSAQAASLALIASANPVTQNSPFTVDLVLTNGPTAVAGGKTVVSFDQTLLSYGSFSLTPGVPDLDFFFNPVVATNGNLKTVTFGFDYAPTGVVGKFTFTPLASPGSIATLGLRDFSQTTGTFFNYAPTYQRLPTTFTGTQVTISAVPLPAGVWLLGTAVGALVARRRLRRAAG